MSLHTQMTAALSVPQQERQYGEAGYYTPAGGTRTAATFIVERDDLRELPGGSAAQQYLLRVRVSRAAVSTVNVGRDLVEVYEHPGDAALRRFKVSELLGQDGTWWRLGLVYG